MRLPVGPLTFITANYLLTNMKRVLIPSTYTADEKNRMLRDYKIGMLARACATFGVDEVVIYFDKDPKFESHALGKYISKILKYLRTPPYLRKYLFPKQKQLRNVGVVPPVNMPSHMPEHFKLKVREGYAVNHGLVDIGLTKNVSVKGVSKGEVVTLDVKTRRVMKPKHYMGYSSKYINKPLKQVLNSLKGYNIGASRYGVNVKDVEMPDNYNLIFGSAYRGLKELKAFDKCDIVVNTVPDQLVKSVRTEEAVYYSLAILNIL